MENKLIDEVKKVNNSVDSLMLLVDSGILSVENLKAIEHIWKEITDIPYDYAMLLAEDNLEGLVRRVVADYNRCFLVGDYDRAEAIHYSNKWLSQIIGAEEYSILSEIYTSIDNASDINEQMCIYDGVTSYKELIDKYKAKIPDVTQYIIRAEELRNNSNYCGMYESIRLGLEAEPCNYELFFSLGEYYLEEHMHSNINQAYLCLQNALMHCSNEDDYNVIKSVHDEVKPQSTVRNTAIIIVSYNACYMLKQNIYRIRESLISNSYKIIVVDNASADGVYEWLKEQDDILLLRNEENLGFGVACNQGAELAKENGYGDYDVFLLNNDTRLADNSLFWLRMGLYGSDDIGASGSISNYAGNEQQVDIEYAMPDDYLEYGRKNNILMINSWEERVRLSGFAMLIRNNVWNLTGGMDSLFSPGYFEDDDLCMKIRESGYRLILCRNSFIYHAGSQSFNKVNNVNELLMNNYKKFIDKYGFTIIDHAYPNRNLLSEIIDNKENISILIYGSRLGANMAYISSVYPDAEIYGIEPDECLRRYSCLNNYVFESTDELYKANTDIIFDYVFINEEMICRQGNKYDYSDVLELFRLHVAVGTKFCIVNNREILCRYYNGLDKIKLIIWDLDDTFWKGTISEGRVLEIEENIRLIKRLVDCGIVNSVSSKNDRPVAVERLTDMGVVNDFVFMDINWEGKGSQISDKIQAMNLRTENTLFIDDNVNNLEEAAYFAKGIMTATPGIIPVLSEYYSAIEPSDTEHKRLLQYRVLEEKNKKEKSFATRDEFLVFSRINVEIHDDCENQIDRIAEMVIRTNQLNYTKNRMSKEEILSLVKDDSYECRYVTASDRFGSHGIVGFYALNIIGNELVHFLFSCRVMGMGVEQYVYNYLNVPYLSVVGEVAVKIEASKSTPWINCEECKDDFTELKDAGKENSLSKLLLKGPCDLASIEGFINTNNYDTEYFFVNEKGVITSAQNHSCHVNESVELTEEEIQGIILSAPMLSREAFDTKIFDGNYKYICYSLLPDCHSGLYKNKKTGLYICFGSKNYDITNEEIWTDLCLGKIVNHSYPFNKEILKAFAKEWEYIGCTPVDMLINNINKIYYRLPKQTVLILILGSEIESDKTNGEFANHAEWHKKINQAITEYAKDKECIRLVNPTRFIQSQDDFVGGTNHYSRNVYYEMANEINRIIESKLD